MQSDDIELKKLKGRHSSSKINLDDDYDLGLSNLRKRSYSKPLGSRNERLVEFNNPFTPENEISSGQTSLDEIEDVDEEPIDSEDNSKLTWKEIFFGVTLENYDSTARDHVSIS